MREKNMTLFIASPMSGNCDGIGWDAGREGRWDKRVRTWQDRYKRQDRSRTTRTGDEIADKHQRKKAGRDQGWDACSLLTLATSKYSVTHRPTQRPSIKKRSEETCRHLNRLREGPRLSRDMMWWSGAETASSRLQ